MWIFSASYILGDLGCIIQQEKLRKEAVKAEVAAMKKVQKEKEKWEKGKFALKSIVAEIDKRVVEVGSIGGMQILFIDFFLFYLFLLVLQMICSHKFMW